LVRLVLERQNCFVDHSQRKLLELLYWVCGMFSSLFSQLLFRSAIFTSSEVNISSTVVLLFAAALATVVTAAAASPFELLRVRSMCLLEATKWTKVLEKFLVRFCCRCILVGYTCTVHSLTISARFRPKAIAKVANLREKVNLNSKT
jgi:hypothetical protein